MPFSQDKLDQVNSGIRLKLASDQLNDWERKFLTSMQSKLGQYGRRTSLSDKQYKRLMQLVGSPTRSNSVGPAETPQRSHKAEHSQVRRSVPVKKSKPASQKPKAYPKRRRTSFRKTYRDVKYAAIAVVVLLGVISSLNSGRVSSPPNSATATYTKAVTVREIGIIDGDTVTIAGESRNVRLVGFNAPETYKPNCQRELDLGNRAKQRLNELVSQASAIEFERVRCACEPGTEGTSQCNFGRICGSLRTDGRDAGRTLISEGLAVRYQCGSTSCPRRPGNWCN